jgi:hypothetical protein
MSHSSTSGILKALAELGEGASHGIDYLLQQVGTLPLAAAFSFFLLLDFIRSELLGDGRPYGASCCRRRLSVPSGAEMTQMGQRQRSWFRFLLHARRRRGLSCSKQTVCWQRGPYWAQRRSLCMIATKTDDAAFSSCLPGKNALHLRLSQPSPAASEKMMAWSKGNPPVH